jgi:plasmid maintenance system killer protein
MKALLFLALISSAFAHEIKGTLLLEGTLKSKTIVKGVKAHCEVEVNKVRNLMEQDSFGNPAYKAWVEMELKADDDKKKVKIKINKEYELTNLFKVGNKTEVRDYEYHSQGDEARLIMDEEGRVKSTILMHDGEALTCIF